LHLGFSWSYGLKPSLGFVNQKIRLKLFLSFIGFSLWVLILGFCGRGLGVVDAGGVLLGRCWVWLTAVACLQHGELAWRWPPPPQHKTRRRLSATKRLCGQRREIKL
jgi:hypothetical protein